MSDFCITAVIVIPAFVVGMFWWLRTSFRATRKEAESLASRLQCPTCGAASLVWMEQEWAVHVHYEDHDELHAGYTFQCSQCKKVVNLSRDGSPSDEVLD